MSFNFVSDFVLNAHHQSVYFHGRQRIKWVKGKADSANRVRCFGYAKGSLDLIRLSRSRLRQRSIRFTQAGRSLSNWGKTSLNSLCPRPSSGTAGTLQWCLLCNAILKNTYKAPTPSLSPKSTLQNDRVDKGIQNGENNKKYADYINKYTTVLSLSLSLSPSLPYPAAIFSVRYGLLAMAMLPYFLKHFRNVFVIVLAKNAWLSHSRVNNRFVL